MVRVAGTPPINLRSGGNRSERACLNRRRPRNSLGAGRCFPKKPKSSSCPNGFAFGVHVAEPPLGTRLRSSRASEAGPAAFAGADRTGYRPPSRNCVDHPNRPGEKSLFPGTAFSRATATKHERVCLAGVTPIADRHALLSGRGHECRPLNSNVK